MWIVHDRKHRSAMTISEIEIEAGAKALRERHTRGRARRKWTNLRAWEKLQWREQADCVLTAAREAREKEEPGIPRPCKWKENRDEGYWATECGHAFCFTVGGPKENSFKFCPYCGGVLESIQPPIVAEVNS